MFRQTSSRQGAVHMFEPAAETQTGVIFAPTVANLTWCFPPVMTSAAAWTCLSVFTSLGMFYINTVIKVSVMKSSVNMPVSDESFLPKIWHEFPGNIISNFVKKIAVNYRIFPTKIFTVWFWYTGRYMDYCCDPTILYYIKFKWKNFITKGSSEFFFYFYKENKTKQKV